MLPIILLPPEKNRIHAPASDGGSAKAFIRLSRVTASFLLYLGYHFLSGKITAARKNARMYARAVLLEEYMEIT